MASKAKKSAKKWPTCGCIDAVNAELKKHNAALDTGMQIDFETGESRLVIRLPVHKLDSAKRKSLPSFYVSFCPVCGKKVNP